jgi:hypothetical protein
MRIVIHGGMFKTGTTSLQQQLHANRKLLAEEGVVYPPTDIGQHSYILNARNPNWDANQLRLIAIEASQTKADILLFSGEAVSALSQQQFNRLTACFKGWPVEYVFCFRHWSSYLPSRWTQNCLRRDSQTFEEYLENVRNPNLMHFDARFDLILTRAAKSGADAVRAVSWDWAVVEHQNAGYEVLKSVGLANSLIEKVLQNTIWSNTRPSILTTEVCRVLNGLLDYVHNRKHDELFWAYAIHAECERFHDINQRLESLDKQLIHTIQNKIIESGLTKSILPAFENLEKKLLDEHGTLFVNLHHSNTLSPTKSIKYLFENYPVNWIEFIDLNYKDSFNRFTQPQP